MTVMAAALPSPGGYAALPKNLGDDALVQQAWPRASAC